LVEFEKGALSEGVGGVSEGHAGWGVDNSDIEPWLLSWLVGHEMLRASATVVQVHGFEAALSYQCEGEAATAMVSSAVVFKCSAVVVSMIWAVHFSTTFFAISCLKIALTNDLVSVLRIEVCNYARQYLPLANEAVDEAYRLLMAQQARLRGHKLEHRYVSQE
jgi:hypothetical protein